MPSPYLRDVRHSPRSSAARRQTGSVGKAGSLVRVITPAPRRVRTPVRRALPLPAQAATNGAVQLAAATTVFVWRRKGNPWHVPRAPLSGTRAAGQAGSPRALRLRQPRPAGAPKLSRLARWWTTGRGHVTGVRRGSGTRGSAAVGSKAATWPVGEPRDQPPTCVAAHPLVRRPPPVRHPRRHCQGGRRRVLGLEMATGRDNAARPQCQPVCSTDYRAPRRSGLVRTLVAVAWTDSRTGRPLGVMRARPCQDRKDGSIAFTDLSCVRKKKRDGNCTAPSTSHPPAPTIHGGVAVFPAVKKDEKLSGTLAHAATK